MKAFYKWHTVRLVARAWVILPILGIVVMADLGGCVALVKP